MTRAGLALGSNLGDRHAHLQAALRCLRAIAIPGEAVLAAPIYQTAPHCCPPGAPEFLNTVVEIAYAGSARDLLDHSRAIETTLGRTRSTRNAPRNIDIDLLYHGTEWCNHADLILPHPRLSERRFVLQPLADIRPELVLPGHQLSIAELLANLHSTEPPLVRLMSVNAPRRYHP